MQIVAYLYSDLLLETAPSPDIWGWDVDLVYQDLGGRSNLTALLAAAPDYLLVRQLTDLADSLSELQAVLGQIQELGIHLIVAEAAGEPVPALLAQIPSNYHSRKLRQSHARRRLQAAPPPGKAPYGYRRGKDRYILDKSTAPVVKEFFERFLIFGSVRGAVRYLEKKYGKKIAASTGLRWLQNPVYRGDTAYGSGGVIPNTHTPILSRDEAAQIDRLLRRNQRLPARTASAPRSLAGLVVCQTCQAVLSVSTASAPRRTTNYTYLRATKCPQLPVCPAIRYDQVLAQTIQQICTELPIAVNQLSAPPIGTVTEQIQQKIANKQQALEQLPALLQQEILDVTTVALRRYQLQTEIAACQQQLAALPPVNLLAIAEAVSIPQFWLDLSEAERRFYLREFIQCIQLDRLSNGEFNLSLRFIF